MRGLFLFICFFSIPSLWSYTPESLLLGPVKSVRTYKAGLRPIPAGEYGETWFPNSDFDSLGRPVSQWFYHMGQVVRRHEYRYEKESEGRERTTWLTFFITPDLRPPLERLSGYEHWYTLRDGDYPDLMETRFETVQNHGVKSIFRYYDDQERLIREKDTLSDLETELVYNEKGQFQEKRGYLGNKTFWHEWFYYNEQNHLSQVIQSDLNRELYQREDYLYGPDKIIFNKYLLEYPIERGILDKSLLEKPWYRTVKYYDSSQRLIKLENYRDQGPLGLLLTQENHYTHDDLGRIIRVEEVNRKQIWEMTYDQEGNWISLTFQDHLNRPSQNPLKWYRIMEYYK